MRRKQYYVALAMPVLLAVMIVLLLEGCPSSKVAEEPLAPQSVAEPQAAPQQRPAVQQPTRAVTQPAGVTVYITNTGEKYHRGTCRYLRQSKIPISLSNAKGRGYTPCKVCRPPG